MNKTVYNPVVRSLRDPAVQNRGMVHFRVMFYGYTVLRFNYTLGSDRPPRRGGETWSKRWMNVIC